MTPLTVIGGYLGAGKTTLINRLLGEDHGLRLAVLVNDFGDINIDETLLQSHDGDTLSLSNGCVCCTIADALGDALDKVLARSPPLDHILVEASGVANPAKVAMYGQGWPGLSLDGVIVVADAQTIRSQADDKFVGSTVRQQLAAGDLFLLSKVDLIDEEQVESVSNWLRAQVPGCSIVKARFGKVSADLLLGALSVRQQLFVPDVSNHAQFHCFSVRLERPLHRARLRAVIAAWPDEVVRAKGLVALHDDPNQHYELQLVGRRLCLRPTSVRDRNGGTEIVVIGVGQAFDPSALEQTLRAVSQ